MKNYICAVLLGFLLMLSKPVFADYPDLSTISTKDKDEIEKIIYEYLTRAETRDTLVKAGLVSPLSVYWDSGLRISSEDGNFKLKIGGRIMNDWGWFNEDDDTRDFIGDQVDGTEFRRSRLFISGQIYGNIGFKAQYDFASGGRPGFKDVYINLKNIPYAGTFTVGHFKEPFSLEELTSSKYITFMERGLNNVFAPDRNTGFMLNNHFLNKKVTYAAGIFRNADGFGDSEGDRSTEGGYSFSGRLTGLPYYEDDGRRLVHLGFSYSHQNAFEDSIRYRQKPEMHLADRFVDTGSFSAERANLFNPELALVWGPFSMQTEYTFAKVDVENTFDVDLGRRIDAGSNPDFTSWYVYASYFITGEHRKYNQKKGYFGRVKPLQNFDWKGGWGAIQIAVRYSELDLNDEEIKGGRLADTTLGINWYLNPNTRIMANYVHTDADRKDVNNANADLFAMRFQIDF